jgi:hypothetical protein
MAGYCRQGPKCATELLAAPSIEDGDCPVETLEDWLYRTSFDQVDFNKMGQRLQIKGPGLSRGTAKKRSWDHKLTYSTINKMGIVLKPLRDR